MYVAALDDRLESWKTIIARVNDWHRIKKFRETVNLVSISFLLQSTFAENSNKTRNETLRASRINSRIRRLRKIFSYIRFASPFDPVTIVRLLKHIMSRCFFQSCSEQIVVFAMFIHPIWFD